MSESNAGHFYLAEAGISVLKRVLEINFPYWTPAFAGATNMSGATNVSDTQYV